MKKFLTILLSLTLLFGTFGLQVNAAPDTEETLQIDGNSKQMEIIKKWQINSIEKEGERGRSNVGEKSFQLHWDKEKGVPRFVIGKLNERAVEGKKDVLSFLQENIDVFNTEGVFKIVSHEKDELGKRHYKARLTIDDIPVYGSEVIVHTDKDDNIYAINGNIEPGFKIREYSKDVKLDESDAVKAAEGILDFTPKPYRERKEEFSEEVIEQDGYTSKPGAELFLYKVKEAWKPVYLVKLQFIYPYPANWHVFVDAEKGDIVKKQNLVEFAATTGTGRGVLGDQKQLNTYLHNGVYYLYDTTKPMSGQIRTYTANNGTRLPGSYVTDRDNNFNASSQGAAVDAHYYASISYDYFYNIHGRNSYDGRGASVISTVNYGNRYNNAFWMGTQMVYGDGDGRLFRPLSASLDVVAHELAHAVTQHSANLEYRNESGALNESFSDVFGVLVEGDRNDWLVGEDCYTPHISGDALRSMKNPTLYNQPDHMKDYVHKPDTPEGDWGGVHTNSGIPNKAFYHIASNIGFNKSGKIYYRALTKYLTSQSRFSDCRNALLQSTADLYGSNGSEYRVVVDAFNLVGIY